ncbi:MAG: efflux RND transporter permease subunit [Immundisolibacteraceae bacterium]|nr:efflux RND transporter permease subunit [Immundisolibacteraceae bacterium]
MKISNLSVERPVLAIVMTLMILLLGIMSYRQLSVREYPDIDTPKVSVRTIYPGASAEIIESEVTRPLEDQLSGIEGIDLMYSNSREEVSEITIEFLLNRDVDSAAADVRDRVARARGDMPDDIKEPIVSKIEADAGAIMWLGFLSDRHSEMEISDFADRFVKDRLQSLPGVATVIIGGERRYSMRIWLDRERLAGFGLTPADVEDALRKQNLEVPSGRIESKNREFSVLTDTNLQTPEEFEALIIREIDDYPVRLRDVGRAEIGPERNRSSIRMDGLPAVGMGIVKQSTANTLEVATAIRTELPAILAALPEGMKFKIGTDQALFIEQSLGAVYQTLAEAMGLVIVVIFLFLRSFRATLIPALAVPVALTGSFVFMLMMGFSVNVLTMLALVLAIGLVVDDAIIVLENIYRRIEEGIPPVKAALVGSNEIGFAILAMMVTLVAVFVPLSFLSGTTGKLFQEFALALVGAVMVSAFVALSLVPMLCSRLLKPTTHNRFYTVTENWLQSLFALYERSLRVTLRARPLVVLAGLIAAVGSYFLLNSLESELAPFEDRSDFVAMLIAPEGSSPEYTTQQVHAMDEIIREIPEVKTSFMVTSPGVARPAPVNIGVGFVTLTDYAERTRSQFDITKALEPKLLALPGGLAFPINRASLGVGGFRDTPVQFVIQGNTYEELEESVTLLMARAREYPGLVNLDTDLKLNKPQYKVTVNRDKAANVGVAVSDIGRTLETLLGGREVTRFKRAGEQYEVIVKLADEDRTNPTDLTSIYVRGRSGELVQLSNLVEIRETVAPKELNHFDRLRAATIKANIAPGYALGEVLDFLEKTAKELLPASTRIDFNGASREFKKASEGLAITFVLALAFVYLVLSAQFESFRGPVIILICVPLAVSGALLGLLLAGQTFNVYSQIGLMMLIGLITKNGILIVEFANQMQAQGIDKTEAVIRASALRLRPILMTSATMVLAAIPLALATGAGAEARHPIGWTVVGGLIIGSLLTLYVVPTAYTYLAGDRSRVDNADDAPVDESLVPSENRAT